MPNRNWKINPDVEEGESCSNFLHYDRDVVGNSVVCLEGLRLIGRSVSRLHGGRHERRPNEQRLFKERVVEPSQSGLPVFQDQRFIADSERRPGWQCKNPVSGDEFLNLRKE